MDLANLTPQSSVNFHRGMENIINDCEAPLFEGPQFPRAKLWL